jgi:hypothetical protein
MGGCPETISTTALQGSIPSTCPPMLVVFATSSSAGGLIAQTLYCQKPQAVCR